ncbi:unnamed protein product, partial [marine sediment metagenome]
FSNHGPNSVDLGAPGSNILSCEPEGGYQYMSGTSMATPHVAGACALLWSINPLLSHSEVKDTLLRTVDKTLPGLCVSEGRLNLYNAVHVLVPSEGYVNLDHDYYACASVVDILLADYDLGGEGNHEVTLTTSGGDSETVILAENQSPIGVFTGTISTTLGDPNIEDGTLQVTHGQTITVTYHDANDATGNPATVTDTAVADCEGPAISNVEVVDLKSLEVTIRFETVEPTTAQIRCGLACSGPYTIASNDLVLATI